MLRSYLDCGLVPLSPINIAGPAYNLDQGEVRLSRTPIAQRHDVMTPTLVPRLRKVVMSVGCLCAYIRPRPAERSLNFIPLTTTTCTLWGECPLPVDHGPAAECPISTQNHHFLYSRYADVMPAIDIDVSLAGIRSLLTGAVILPGIFTCIAEAICGIGAAILGCIECVFVGESSA